MKLRTIIITGLAVVLFATPFISCEKTGFLEAKPDDALVVPETLADLQALLDNDKVMNGAGGFGIVPALGEMGTTDFYLPGTGEDLSIPQWEMHAYTWQKTVYTGENILDWGLPYTAIFYANMALAGLENIPVTGENRQEHNLAKGAALFYRSFMNYHLAQVFAPAYDNNTAGSDWGIPLRMHADINEQVNRATVRETYDRILTDLYEAKRLLPGIALYATRPSKAAAHALLCKVLLNMYRYEEAFAEADSCLELKAVIIDYNTVPVLSFPFIPVTEETIFYATAIPHRLVTPFIAAIDKPFYESYAGNDLRKQLFFSEMAPGIFTFSGSYGQYELFNGIATDEIILTRAECNARMGNTAAALNDLNGLLEKRYRAGTFTPVVAADASQALEIILSERRKELVMRGTRWTDLRRLNKEGMYITQLSRTINNQLYELAPDDPRYTYPVPDAVMEFNPAMPQNIR